MANLKPFTSTSQLFENLDGRTDGAPGRPSARLSWRPLLLYTIHTIFLDPRVEGGLQVAQLTHQHRRAHHGRLGSSGLPEALADGEGDAGRRGLLRGKNAAPRLIGLTSDLGQSPFKPACVFFKYFLCTWESRGSSEMVDARSMIIDTVKSRIL